MIQSVDRALSLLKLIAEYPQGVGARALARISGLKASTVQNLIKTMEQKGFLYADPITRRYYIGSAIVSLAKQVNPLAGYRAAALPTLTLLQSRYGVAVSLQAWERGQCYLLARGGRDGQQVIETEELCLPMRFSAGYNALIAFLPEVVQSRYIEHVFSVEEDRRADVSAPDDYFAEYQLIKKQGYAENNGRGNPYVGAIAVPVFIDKTQVVMSITVSNGREAFKQLSQQEMLTVMTGEAKKITENIRLRSVV